MKKFFILLFFTFSVFFVSAQKFPEAKSYVNDYAKVMSENDRKEALSLLYALEKQTGNQVCVVTVKSLSGYSIEEYAFNTAEQNKIGQKGKDNGVLLLVSTGDRALRIETGYGLEGQLTDTKCGLIIRNTIIPYFKEGNYSQGILNGVKKIALVLCPDGIEGQNIEITEIPEKSSSAGPFLGFLFIFIWFIVFSCIASGRQNHFLPWILWAAASNHSHSGFYYNSRDNFDFFHSNHGGGSGGFSGGGGHFGGGGSSGHW